jgi:hypothetical protein
MANPAPQKKGRFSVAKLSAPAPEPQELPPGTFTFENPDLPGQAEDVEILLDGRVVRTLPVQLDKKGRGDFTLPPDLRPDGRRLTFRHPTGNDFDATNELRSMREAQEPGTGTPASGQPHTGAPGSGR